jgi:hypothetical protein
MLKLLVTIVRSYFRKSRPEQHGLDKYSLMVSSTYANIFKYHIQGMPGVYIRINDNYR